MTLSTITLQCMQILTVLLLSPLLEGIIVQFESRVKRHQGAGLFQPYRDLCKLFCKGIVLPKTASWFFVLAPVIAFVVMLIVSMLIPVLTSFPLPFSDMGDILGGGLLLALGSFVISLVGLDTGSAYGGMGASRTSLLGILSEPVFILIFVGISLLANSMLPFTINRLLVETSALYWNPAHLFLVFAFFIVLTVETGRMPIHSGSHIEIYMIEESRILECSGPLLGLLKWASMMKQFLLYTLFCNLLFFPWWLSASHGILWGLLAIILLFVKYTFVACMIVFVNTSRSRLRFFRYQEPLALAFVFAFTAVLIKMIGGA